MGTLLFAAITKTPPTGHVSTVADVSVAHVFFQMVVALLVIIGGIWALGKIVAHNRTRRLTHAKDGPASGLRVLHRQSLGKDQQLAVVRWRGREVLVGISGSTISFFEQDHQDDGFGSTEMAEELSGGSFGGREHTSSLFSTLRTTTRSAALIGGERGHAFIESLRDATSRN